MNPKPFSPDKKQSATEHLPLISIIMPAHNTAPYIGQAIESVLAQTYPRWELLIIDDASTDQTGAIVKTFNDPRIRYQKRPRIGHPAGVRNAGLRLAQGEFIAFLDSDDLYYPDTLEKLSTPLREKPNLISVYGFAFEMDEQGQPLPSSVQLSPDPSDNGSRLLPPTYQHSWEHIVTSKISNMLGALMIRSKALKQIGFFNEALYSAEDYEFYVRMFLHNHAGVQCVPAYMYQYRLHTASLTKVPDHCYRVLNSCLSIMNWLFTEASIPDEAHAFQSQAYVASYRYLARERLLNHQPTIARNLALKAFKDSHIKPVDALKACGPILIRSFLPTDLDQALVRIRRQIQNRLHTIKQSPPYQAGANA